MPFGDGKDDVIKSQDQKKMQAELVYAQSTYALTLFAYLLNILSDLFSNSAHGIFEVGAEQQRGFASAPPSYSMLVRPEAQSSTWPPLLPAYAAAGTTEQGISDPSVIRPLQPVMPEVAALGTQNYSVLSCSHACLLDPQYSVPEDGTTIHHGDNENVLSCRLMNLKSEATNKGQKTPRPWINNGTISAQYVLDASLTNSDVKSMQINDPRINRIVLADDDARRLHDASKQTGCSTIDFQKVLDDSHADKKSTERIVCQIRCKAIINIASLAGLKQDLVGDCSVILSENTDPNNRYRQIYFVQARPDRLRFFFCVEPGFRDDCPT